MKEILTYGFPEGNPVDDILLISLGKNAPQIFERWYNNRVIEANVQGV